jgi:hypothetical protein
MAILELGVTGLDAGSATLATEATLEDGAAD